MTILHFSNFKYTVGLVCLITLFFGCAPKNEKQSEETSKDRPNILWITIEDWSPDLSCYGTKGIYTPHVDKLAAEGVLFKTAFTTSPVCSPSRTAMMTGFHQNYIGGHQHRTNVKKVLPYGIRPIPELVREAGYFTTLMSYKTDVNFLPDTKEELFLNTNDWSDRAPGQPFFARITFPATHRKWNRDPERPISIDDVELPPYYSDTPFNRRDWANGLEQMQIVDRQIGDLLQRLDEEGIADNTIVFFIGDHGGCHIRGKQFLYDSGIQIPMIMRWPGKVKAGTESDNLVMSIDICATILDVVGAVPPVPLHGKNLFGKEVAQRKYVFAARDKMDQTHDAMRAIRSKKYKLIYNLMPERPYLQYNEYKEKSYPMLAEMNIRYLKGMLKPEEALFFAPTKPEVELFDVSKDPHEVNNLAMNPDYSEIKDELLAELNSWRKDIILDTGVASEFLGHNVFPKQNPLATVDEWTLANEDKYDFKKTGWPSWYPTRTLEEWEIARDKWEPYVMRSPSENVSRPQIGKRIKKTKKK